MLEGMTKPALNTSTVRMHVDHLEGSSGYIDRVDGLWWKNNKQQGILPISFKIPHVKAPEYPTLLSTEPSLISTGPSITSPYHHPTSSSSRLRRLTSKSLSRRE